MHDRDGIRCRGTRRDANGVGKPVNVVRGIKFLTGDEDLDFALPSTLPLLWQRGYFSDIEGCGWLGQGWSLPFAMHIRCAGGHVLLIDDQDNELHLPLSDRSATTTVRGTDFRVCREANGRFRLEAISGESHYLFAPLALDSADRAGERAEVFPLVCVADRHGDHTRFVYDGSGLPVCIVDAAGRTLALLYTSIELANGAIAQRLHQVVLREAALVSYEYSPEGDLARVRNHEGEPTREFRYRNHILIEHGRPGALVARYEYDRYTTEGKVLRTTTNLGQCWQFSYRRNHTVVTDPLGRTESHSFNDDGIVVAHVDMAGNTTRRDVDGRGNAIRTTDAVGRTSYISYDRWDNVTSTMNATGERTDIEHHPTWHLPAVVTDPTGAATRYEYDDRGNLIRQLDAAGQMVEYAYDDRGRLVLITDPHGGQQRFTYDVHGQLLSRTDCSRRTTVYQWDDNGYLASETDATGATTRYQHDSKGRVLAIQHADGAHECFRYDVHGRLVEHLEPRGARTRWELTLDGLPAARIDALGHRISYEYDAVRRLRTLTNENGAQSSFVYDAAGRQIEETGFDGRVIRHLYDASGLPVERFEPDSRDATGHEVSVRTEAGLRIGYEWDEAQRLIAMTSARTDDKRAQRCNWRYDRAARISGASNDWGRVEFHYDALGRLVDETSEVLDWSWTLAWEHDAMGNHIATVLPNGRRINFLYYGSGHLHQINLDGQVICDIERDELHREATRTQGQLVSRFQYDSMNRLVAQQTLHASNSAAWAAPVISRTYDYEPGGNLQTAADLRARVRQYRYDLLGRLVEADRERFAFDPAHNLLDQRDARQSMDNRITKFHGCRYAYDQYGNVVEKIAESGTRIRCHYSRELRMDSVSVTNTTLGMATGFRVEYGYDALGRRVYRKDASGVTLFLWEGDCLLGEIRDDRTYVYVYLPNTLWPLAQIEFRGEPGDLDVHPPVIRYYHTDPTGAPRELTGADGRIQWRAEYAAWGKRLEPTYDEFAKAGGPIVASMADEVHQPLRFPGQYFDAETGLHYAHQRYYDPDTGRYVTQQPIGMPPVAHLNRYVSTPI